MRNKYAHEIASGMEGMCESAPLKTRAKHNEDGSVTFEITLSSDLIKHKTLAWRVVNRESPEAASARGCELGGGCYEYPE